MATRVMRSRSCKKRSLCEEENLDDEEIQTGSKKKVRKTTSRAEEVKPQKAVKKEAKKSISAKPKSTKNVRKSVKRDVPLTESSNFFSPRRRSDPKETTEKKSEEKPTVEEPKADTTVIVLNETADDTLVADDEDDDDKVYIEKDLWINKYRPSEYGVFLGNKNSVENLEKWLLDWKDESKRPYKNMGNSHPTHSDSNSSSQDVVTNVLLITGPPGVGKTSLVYYLANKHGYKVLEMNASSERSGRKVLADLQEATQSRHVEGTKVSKGISSFFKPTIFAQTPTSSTSATKVKKNQKKGAPQPTNPKGKLSFFFSPKTSGTSPSGDQPPTTPTTSNTSTSQSDTSRGTRRKSLERRSLEIKEEEESIKNDSFGSPEIETNSNCSEDVKEDQAIKCSAATIILFDDVDVIFDDNGDEGFWNALETVLKISKKPCILTATRGIDEILKKCKSLSTASRIDLHRPSPSSVIALVEKICEMEERDLTDYNIDFMCQYLASDVRRILNQLEFETISSGFVQTLYPVNKTLSMLFSFGATQDIIEIQSNFQKAGFNAVYSSIEDALPYNFEDVSLPKPVKYKSVEEAEAAAKSLNDSKRKKPSAVESETLDNLCEMFDSFCHYDHIYGRLSQFGHGFSTTYERSERWVSQKPLEHFDVNFRSIEDNIEMASYLLVNKTTPIIQRISDIFANDDDGDASMPSVKAANQFRNIPQELKKLKNSKRSIQDTISIQPQLMGTSAIVDYSAALSSICEAEEHRRSVPETKRNHRFLHYLPNNGMYLTQEQMERFAQKWS